MIQRSILAVTICVLAGLSVTEGAAKTHDPDKRAVIGLRVDGDWRRVATVVDRDRLRDWRTAWLEALAKAQASPNAATVTSDPLLFDPDRALLKPVPPPGTYRCRVIKLGAHGTAMRDVTTYPAVKCRIDVAGATSSLHLATGGQRPVGLVYPDGPARAVFLGTMVFGDETNPLDYSVDTNRDLAGYVERIGDARWRLVLPHPHFESLLDVIEIVPAAP